MKLIVRKKYMEEVQELLGNIQLSVTTAHYFNDTDRQTSDEYLDEAIRILKEAQKRLKDCKSEINI